MGSNLSGMFISQNGHSVEDEESDSKDIDLLPPPLKIVTFKEAIDSLQDVTNFLESRSCFTEATDTSCLIDRVAMLHSINARQSTLDESNLFVYMFALETEN